MDKYSKVIIAIVVAIVAIGVVWGVSEIMKGTDHTQDGTSSSNTSSTDKSPKDNSPKNEQASLFQKKLTDRALARAQHPIEGFDAAMLLDIFPGLQESDFDNVKTGASAQEGMHTYADGQLQWERTSDQPTTSAEKTISTQGYGTLLTTLSERLTMPATSQEEIVSIIDKIDIPADITKHIISKMDDIRVHTPYPLTVISSPLTVYGDAHGSWFFENDFQLILVDWDGKIIANGYASGQQDFNEIYSDTDDQTRKLAPFKGTIEFTNPNGEATDKDSNVADFMKRGTLIFQKANASGLPEHDDALEIPVLFE